jgi:antitoxin component of MazEF toxin-antitoxin module/ribosomal protein L29
MSQTQTQKIVTVGTSHAVTLPHQYLKMNNYTKDTPITLSQVSPNQLIITFPQNDHQQSLPMTPRPNDADLTQWQLQIYHQRISQLTNHHMNNQRRRELTEHIAKMKTPQEAYDYINTEYQKAFPQATAKTIELISPNTRTMLPADKAELEAVRREIAEIKTKMHLLKEVKP